MDNRVLFKLTYGLFMLSVKNGERANGCIINTCMQVANNPARVAISVLNKNLTCEMIKESGFFALSILDDSCIFDTIKYFGMQSGREVDKFSGIDMPFDCNDIPYLAWSTCAVISARVVDSIDLGSHTMFIAEITDLKKLNDNKPLTYSYYHENIKPKPQEKATSKKIVAWKCKICGYVYEGEELPDDYLCPLCGHGADDFEPVYE